MLRDIRIDTKLILAALWTSVMFCYLYGDFFGLFMPGQLATMNRGEIPPFGAATAPVMLFVSSMMILPSLMIFLSIALPARINRVVNIGMGLFYSLIISLTMWTSASFILFGVVEISLTLLVCYHALRWPRT